MSYFTYLRKQIQELQSIRRAARRSRKPIKRAMRPELQQMEDRVVPASIKWIGVSGANWSSGGSWQGGVVPGSSDTAVFDATLAAPGVVNVDTPETVGGILFSNSSGSSFTI